MNRNRYGSHIILWDLLFNIVMVTVLLFAMAIAMVHPAKEVKAGVELKAEFMITMSWPDESFDDIDLWMKTPDNQYVFFRNRDIGYAILDHDDLGASTNIFFRSNEPVMIHSHQEIITIRAIQPGHYVVNTHVYRVNSNYRQLEPKIKLPYDVTVKMMKLNPVVKDIVEKKVTVSEWNDEITVFSFDIMEDGTVVKIDTDTQYKMVQHQMETMSITSPVGPTSRSGP